MAARTGAEYLKGLKRKQRELYLHNERVDDVAGHPALAGAAATLASLFDLQHQKAEDCLCADEETGELINRSHMFLRSKEDLRSRRRALEHVHRHTVGHFGRSPDYCNMSFAGWAQTWKLWAGPDGRNEEGAHRMIAYQKKIRREDLVLTHALHHPTINKSRDNMPFNATSTGIEISKQQTIPVHKVDETANSIIVSGCRIVATLGPYADHIDISAGLPLPAAEGAEKFALCFSCPVDLPGMTFVCRDSNSNAGFSEWDKPLSTRFDEQDCIVFFDRVEIPKEYVFVDGDIEIHNQCKGPGWQPTTMQTTTVRALTKLELAYGLASRMAAAHGDRGEITTDLLGEILSYIEMTRNALVAAEDNAYDYGDGAIFPDGRAFDPVARILVAQWMPRVYEILRVIGSHSLFLTPSRWMLDNKRLRPLFDRYFHGANVTAYERARLFRLAADFVLSGFGARNELYECHYIGSARTNRKTFVLKVQNRLDARTSAPLDAALQTRAEALVDAALAAVDG